MMSADNSTNAYEFTISLRVRHPSIDPSAITEALGIEPQHTWRAGQPRRSETGETLDGDYRESYWMGRLMPMPELSSGESSVESVVLQTLALLRRAEPFLARLSTEGGIAELHISLYSRENFRLDFPAESLALLGRLGLAIALEIYPISPRNLALPAH